MSKWDIDPAGVGVVTSRVGDVMTALDGITEAYGADLEGAATSAGTLSSADTGGKGPVAGLVGSALVEFIEGTTSELQFIGARTGKSVNGAIEATLAYESGDLEMAAQVQHQAAGVVEDRLEIADLKRGRR
ncbi:DUF6507 family protein [Streptomyces sp. SAS_270]|uniref:DUF6507 family protein n=1 Tax=Streptomyces sp. SAS_270 TaxID=3412748 RepID=UPI00403D499E